MENKEQRTRNAEQGRRTRNKERGAKDELFQGSDLLVKVRLPLLLSRGAL